VRRAVDSARQPADDEQASLGQVPRHPVGYLIPVRRRTSRADDGDRVTPQSLRIAAPVQQRRRIVDLQQAMRVFGILPVKQAAARPADLRQFLLGIAKSRPRRNRLRRGGRQTASLQLGERRVEHAFRRAELPQQLACQSRAQSKS
jgi:hypothetical protein